MQYLIKVVTELSVEDLIALKVMGDTYDKTSHLLHEGSSNHPSAPEEV